MRYSLAALVFLAACGSPGDRAAAPRPDSIAPAAVIDSFAVEIEGPENVSVWLPEGEALERAAVRVGGTLFHYAATVTYAPDSTLTIKQRVYLRNFKAGDSLVFTWHALPKWPTRATLLASPVVEEHRAVNSLDSLLLPAPAYGDTVSFLGCGQIKYGKNDSLGVKNCWTTVGRYIRPAAPDAVIDSIRRIVLRGEPLVLGGPWHRYAWQSEAQATDSNRVRWCAFAEHASGRRTKMQNSWNLATCERLYQGWLAERAS